MRISDQTLEHLLLEHKLASVEQVATLKEEAASSGEDLQALAIKGLLATEETLAKIFAEYAHVPFIELDPKDIPAEVLNKIPERIARQYNAILFRLDEDGTAHLAMDDPDDVQAISFIQKEVGENLKLYLATHENILACLQGYRGDVSQELSKVIEGQVDEPTKAEQVTADDIAEDSPIAQTVNLLLEYAVRSSASDIHIEPREGYVQIRYRIDGVLKEVNRLPITVLNSLISRIKILSNLKIDEHRVPQDGRFKVNVVGKQYALRVSTLPITDGEKVVMRILDESNQAVTLEQLGYWGHSLEVISSAMHEPNGMILVTGPTGSGKSTSLFSVLTKLNTPNVNISTIEDPVEYKIQGVNQVQTNVKAGMTFASGLRALLRQDPNIIMVGEIRDGETANLGVQAALTGHLVFSTLHTNNAATTLPRLLDMGIEPFLIASTVKAVVGQRLVRRLCDFCKESHDATPAEVKTLLDMFHLKEKTGLSIIHGLEKQAAEQGVGKDTPMSTESDKIKTIWRASAEGGCDECNHTGYKGRIGIYEVLGNSAAIQKLIMAGATSQQIQEQAIKEEMVTMQSDGLVKMLRGNTSLEEVMRVTKE